VLLTQIVDAFCSKVEKAGCFVGFYASTSWLLNKLDTAALSKKYTLWKADYRTAFDRTIACDMHQYTSGATVAGIGGRVDMSNCYVDFASVIKNAGLNGFNKRENDMHTDKENNCRCDSCEEVKKENAALKAVIEKIRKLAEI